MDGRDSYIRQATNPLSNEKLTVRNVINGIVDSECLGVLRSLNELPTPTEQTELVEHSSASRQTITSHLGVLRNRGFIKSHEAGIEPTGGGKVLLETIEECLKTVSEDELAHLTRSEHPINVLLTLYEAPQRASDLPAAVSSEPSRSTVGRFLEFSTDTDHNWTRDKAGQQQITAIGKEVLLAYDKLAASVEQLIEKAAWLQRLPPEDATFPVRELRDATVVASDTNHPASVLWAALKLCDLRLSRFRTLCSIYNPILYHTYRMLLDFDVEAEAILDWSSYIQASRNKHTQYAVRSSAHSDYQPLHLEESHTLGIGLYDSRKVAIGAYNERGRGKHIAMIVSSNEKLVEWGEQLYDSYREKARHSHENSLNDATNPPSKRHSRVGL